MDDKINKIDPVIIIQARMGSTRLPGKVMERINGIPLIGYQIKRLQESQLKIVVATPDNGQNKELIKYVQSLGVQTFEGDTLNVLKRFYDTALYYGAQHIIRITGDNPLIDGVFIKNQIKNFHPKSNNYYFAEGLNKGLPLGTSFEMFSFELLEKAFKKAKSPEEFEHVTPFMVQNLPGDIDQYILISGFDAHHLRLTIDTNEDFNLLQKLICEYSAQNLSIKEIISLMTQNEGLTHINQNVSQVQIRNLSNE